LGGRSQSGLFLFNRFPNSLKGVTNDLSAKKPESVKIKTVTDTFGAFGVRFFDVATRAVTPIFCRAELDCLCLSGQLQRLEWQQAVLEAYAERT
jgi:hypothetical protein